LTYTYLVELWPYAERSRGIAYFQLWGRLSAFFTTFINPIGMENIQWRWLIFYCAWLGFENVFIYFMFPETFGRTLEELAFSKSPATPRLTCADLLQFLRTRNEPTAPLQPSRRLARALTTMRSVSTRLSRTSISACKHKHRQNLGIGQVEWAMSRHGSRTL
jgi:MFS family permease